MFDNIMKEALEVVNKREGRNLLYDIADMWSAYLKKDIDAHDVAAMMILLKITRISETPTNKDHWVDICGYSELGGDTVVE